MNLEKIRQYITRVDDETVALKIDLRDKNVYGAGVKILDIEMHWISLVKEGGEVEEDDDFYDSDLGVNWDMTGVDDLNKVVFDFYRRNEFREQLREILADVGFSAAAVARVDGSEEGMQDDGRASYDANGIADEVRLALGIN